MMFMKARRANSPSRWFLMVCVNLSAAHALAAEQEKKSAPVPFAPAQTEQQTASGSTLPGYSIKPSDLVLPDDVPAGKYRRVIVPYPNWTLICDENLKEQKRICNISQQIVDLAGNIAFSWSLAGTGDGKPVIILRTPASAGTGTAINLAFPDKRKPIRIATDACDMKVCVAMLAVGPRMRKYIGNGSDVEVSFPLPHAGSSQASRIVIKTTFGGLSSALAAI